MTRPRTSPYMYVTWIPRYLTGDKSCLFAAWFKANHQNYKKMPSDFNSAKWNMEHTDLMNELVEELEERGCQIFIERQNSFRVESACSGVVVGGTPDIIAVHPDETVKIYDAKTGQESASHIVQVQLYMYLLPKSEMKRWRDKKIEGVVVYADGSEKRISADSVDDAFVSRVAEFMRKITSDMLPRRVPSLSECRWCELTKADSPTAWMRTRIDPVLCHRASHRRPRPCSSVRR